MFDRRNSGVESMTGADWWPRIAPCFFIFVLAVIFGSVSFAQDPIAPSARVVVLGTGNPSADPERWGPAVAVVVNNKAYLIDCGPGGVRGAAGGGKNGI